MHGIQPVLILCVLIGLNGGPILAGEPGVRLSEILYNPIKDENINEFVEIVNHSDTPVNLDGWRLCDEDQCDQLLPVDSSLILSPGQYGLILVPDYFKNEGLYSSLIPDSALLITIDDASLGNRGLANSRSECVTLLSPQGDSSSHAYSIPVANGFSKERRYLDQSNTAENWSTSKTQNGTPGNINSIAPPPYDVRLYCTLLSQSTRKDSVFIHVHVQNIGTKTLSNLVVALWNFTGDKKISSITIDSVLQPTDSLTTTFGLSPLHPNHHIRMVTVSTDSFSWSDTVSFSVDYCPGDVIVNEYSSQEHDWIELYNVTQSNLTLSGWTIEWTTFEGTVDHTIEAQSAIAPNGFYLLSSGIWQDSLDWICRSPWYSRLPDSFTDHIASAVLYSPLGSPIDSVRINRSETHSMERRAPSSEAAWIGCRHPFGSTPGETNSHVRSFSDPALQPTAVYSPSEIPGRGDSIRVSIPVVNWGNQTAYVDSIGIEQIDTKSNRSILSTHYYPDSPLYPLQRDTILCALEPKPGCYSVVLTLYAGTDMYPNNNRRITSQPIGYQYNDIVINEIQFNTDNTQSEWIELFNPLKQSVDITGWTVCDAHRCISLAETAPIIIDEYWVLVKDTSRFVRRVNAPVMEVSLPPLNNSGDIVCLYDVTGGLIDSVDYVGPTDLNRSMERIRYEWASSDPDNWTQCQNMYGSTPGFLNSVSPRQIDAGWSGPFTIESKSYHVGDPVTLTMTAFNAGRHTLNACEIHLWQYDGRDGSNKESIARMDIATLAPFQTRPVQCEWIPGCAGLYTLEAEIVCPDDQNTINDRLDTLYYASYPSGTLVINEVMNRPAVGEPEWIELYNATTDPIDSWQWRFHDNRVEDSIPLNIKPPSIPPGAFLVFGDDSTVVEWLPDTATFCSVQSLPALNLEDTLVVLDCNNVILDSVIISAELKGKSMERISPQGKGTSARNWTASVDPRGHTAGKVNSVAIQSAPDTPNLIVQPNPFTPNGDGHDDHTSIHLELPLRPTAVNIKVFDIKGQRVRFLCNNEAIGHERKVIWDGKDDDGRRCRMGIYIIHVEAWTVQSTRSLECVKTVVLAQPL